MGGRDVGLFAVLGVQFDASDAQTVTDAEYLGLSPDVVGCRSEISYYIRMSIVGVTAPDFDITAAVPTVSASVDVTLPYGLIRRVLPCG